MRVLLEFGRVWAAIWKLLLERVWVVVVLALELEWKRREKIVGVKKISSPHQLCSPWLRESRSRALRPEFATATWVLPNIRRPIPGWNAGRYGYLFGGLPTQLDRRKVGYTRLPTRPHRYQRWGDNQIPTRLLTETDVYQTELLFGFPTWSNTLFILIWVSSI